MKKYTVISLRNKMEADNLGVKRILKQEFDNIKDASLYAELQKRRGRKTIIK